MKKKSKHVFPVSIIDDELLKEFRENLLQILATT